MPGQNFMLGAAGLVTNPNALTDAPQGALVVAKNIVIDRPGVIEPRRGLPFAADTWLPNIYNGRARRLTTFDGHLVATYTSAGVTGDQLMYLTTSGPLTGNGSWTIYSGTYPPVDSDSVKTRFAKAGGSLFFTSSTGLYKLDSITGNPVAAGGLKAIPGYSTGLLNSVAVPSTNWLAAGATVAYRVLITYQDAQQRLIRGEPSGRLVVTNTAGATRVPQLRIPLPRGITVDHTVEVYRSAANTSGEEPSDDLGLVYQIKPSSSQVSNLYLDFDDETTDNLRGQSLYTNVRQEGIAQAATRPPICDDAALFGSSLWVARTTGLEQMLLQLIGTGGNGLNVGDRLVLDGHTYIGAAAENLANSEFLVDTSSTATPNIRNTVQSLINCILYRARTSGSYGITAQHLSTSGEIPGKMLFEAEQLGYATFCAGVSAHGAAFQPQLPTAYKINSGSLTRSGSTVTATTTASHGFTTGDTVCISSAAPDAAFPTGYKTITVTGATTFTYSEAGSATSSTVIYDAVATTVESQAQEGTNRVAFSRDDEFEAFPVVNEFLLGAASAPVLRLVPTKDSLWVFKTDGVWRISGTDSTNYAAQAFDPTLRLFAPDSAVALGNQVYCWANQGLVALSETGARVISFPIEDKLRAVRGTFGDTDTKNRTFGISYESDRKYILVVPDPDNVWGYEAMYVYNYATQAWVMWDPGRPLLHGIVDDQLDDKLYLALDQAFLIRENKTLTDDDYSDEYNGTTGAQTGQVAFYVQWTTQVGDNPGTLKHFQNLDLFFKTAPAADQYPSIRIGSDWGTEQELYPTALTAGNKVCRFEVPFEARRGTQLSVFLGMSGTTSYVPVLLGAQIIYRSVSTRTSK